MAGLETVTFTIALITLGLSIFLGVWRFIAARGAVVETAGGEGLAETSGNRLPTYLTLSATILSLALITVSLSARAAITGHGPFSSMYEFAVAFAWGIIAAGLFFWWRYRMLVLSVIGTVIALGLMLFARAQPSAAAPLVPALQQSVLLTVHVASAVISYGAFTIGFASAILYLFRSRNKDRESEVEKLDDISYHAVMVGFPFMTLVIVLGALWADVAWGTYWNWDPKETASLVTWLLYAGYLHARVLRGWRGRRAAVLLIIGFAAVIFTFFGNYIFSGLHSYG